MQDSLQDQFIQKLEEQYGPWERATSRFGSATFGKIAKDLCISASQFSKLIYGTATEGMYTRSIRNVERLIEENEAKKEREKALQQWEEAKTKSRQQGLVYKRRLLVFGVLALLMGGTIGYALLAQQAGEAGQNQIERQHPLSPYFDREFNAAYDSPYLKESEVQDYCPCSAYEGRWSLSAPYKLPLPGNKKPGVYYSGKSADVRMKCYKSETGGAGKGHVLVAYEYLVNEIWVDTKLTPLSPTYFDKAAKTFTPAFDSLSFEGNPQFEKVATIHSFFIDKFEIYPDSITRKGEPCGRFATDIDQELVRTYEIDLKNVLQNVLGDLNKTDCSPSPNPYCDPNDLQEGESVINFDCMYTITSENLGMGGGYPYRKGYRLEEQSYSDNLTCSCEEE
jgi:hypothetical protein